MKGWEAAWLAGLLEGEGSFSIERERMRPVVIVSMTDQDVVERAAALMGGSVSSFVQHATAYGSKPVYRTRVLGGRAARLMRELYPLLGQRRRARIDEVLAECDVDSTRYSARKKEEVAA